MKWSIQGGTAMIMYVCGLLDFWEYFGRSGDILRSLDIAKQNQFHLMERNAICLLWGVKLLGKFLMLVTMKSVSHD